MPASVPIQMQDGPQFRAGEWTDDTCQAIAIAVAAAEGPLNTPESIQIVASNFKRWFQEETKGIGNQTSWIFARAGHFDASELKRLSSIYAESFPRSAGNGSLMRTGPVALAFLRDELGFLETVREIGSLTHADPSCLEACEIWSVAIRHAIFNDNFDGFQLAIDALPEQRKKYWQGIKYEAEQNEPWHFVNNGWVVQSIQAAWSAITRTDQSTEGHLEAALKYAVRCGHDTDTVAAIAGALLGARWGAGAVPKSWASQIYGWPSMRAENLGLLAKKILLVQGL